MAKRIDYIKVLKPKVRRKGVHAKTKMSSIKGSKLYKKKYRGQGWEDEGYINHLRHHQKQALKDQDEDVYVRIIHTL